MYKRILVPLENSPCDETILQHVRGIARHDGSALVLIHVADGFVARNQELLNLADSEEIHKDQDYLRVRESELRGEGFEVLSLLAKGEPAPAIIAAAKEQGCDLIAMSTHGHGFFKDVLLGSVAERVRHNTDIPVLMLRAPRQ